MTDTTPIDVEIRSWIAAVPTGEAPLRESYLWFVPATLDVERTGNREGIRLAHDIVHFFSELSAGELSYAEVLSALELAASSSASG